MRSWCQYRLAVTVLIGTSLMLLAASDDNQIKDENQSKYIFLKAYY